MRDRTAKALSTFHTMLYRASHGRIGRRLVNNDMLLLTTTGRHSGQPHTVPLLYLRHGDDYVVIASWGGRDQHPEWYRNLRADPGATIQVLGKRHRVIAETAPHEIRAELWPRVLDAYDGYRVYQSRTDREIPVVLLHPASPGR
jgi:deazaflavin-dependent oxidoreductase (nitroreductase family)